MSKTVFQLSDSEKLKVLRALESRFRELGRTLDAMLAKAGTIHQELFLLTTSVESLVRIEQDAKRLRRNRKNRRG